LRFLADTAFAERHWSRPLVRTSKTL